MEKASISCLLEKMMEVVIAQEINNLLIVIAVNPIGETCREKGGDDYEHIAKLYRKV